LTVCTIKYYSEDKIIKNRMGYPCTGEEISALFAVNLKERDQWGRGGELVVDRRVT
jgi:hypothetical protein